MGLRTAREEIFFLSRWLRAPLKTGSVRPSGRDLTRLIAGAVADLEADEWVVELGGSLVQYSYGPVCPVSRTLRIGLGIYAKYVGTAWRNLPPARVWEFKKQDAAQQASNPGQRQSAA